MSAARRGGPAGAGTAQPAQSVRHWTFLNNHAHVLLCLARDPGIVLREVARQVGVTERAIQIIVKDLVDGGVLARQRVGRRNSYRIDPTRPLRHPLESHHTVGELLAMLLTPAEMRGLRRRADERRVAGSERRGARARTA